jgi:hypothetical protein
MNVRNDISEELRSLSELVATISRETPYRVADGYFTDLAERILLRVKTQHRPLAFKVPEGYFEGFAEGVLARIKAGAAKGSGGGPTGPGGTDEGLARADRDLAGSPGQGLSPVDRELAELSPLLAQLRALPTYRLPEGYFDELSPLLTIAKELNPYTVPVEYFQQLPAAIGEKLVTPRKEPAPARVVPFGRRRTQLWKYSAAAVVAGLIFSIGWLRLHVSGGGDSATSADITASVRKISDQDLQRFLADQDTTLAQPSTNLVNQDFTENDIKSLLGEVPDGELKQYMEEHGGANDIATN